jgi:hypothetical protein
VDNLTNQFIVAFSNAFPTLGFIAAWLIYLNTENLTQASIGFLLSSIPAILRILINHYKNTTTPVFF